MSDRDLSALEIFGMFEEIMSTKNGRKSPPSGCRPFAPHRWRLRPGQKTTALSNLRRAPENAHLYRTENENSESR